MRNLSDRELGIIGECLRAASDGPFFPDWEFSTLFGLEREQVRMIASEWPINKPDDISDVDLAVNNALNNLLGYPHGQDDEWPKWISYSRHDVVRVLCNWRGHAQSGHPDDLQ